MYHKAQPITARPCPVPVLLWSSLVQSISTDEDSLPLLN